MSEAILGYTGFVGGFLRETRPDAELFNSTNFQNLRGRTFDTIYCATVPAVKWLANKDPVGDARAIQAIQDVLATVQCRRHFVLISTIDVHDHSTQHQREDQAVIESAEPYGRHRLEFERWVRTEFEAQGAHVCVLRLPALFGIGLKKNVLYDLLNARLLHTIRLDSEFQWYSMRWLEGDIQHALEQGIQLAHLYLAEPIRTRDIVESVFPELLPMIEVQQAELTTPRQVYWHDTVHDRFRRSREEVLEEITDFARLHRFVHRPAVGWAGPTLAVSNLHWEPRDDEHAAFLLRRYGIPCVELAPTKYAAVPGAASGVELWQDVLGRLPAIVQRYSASGLAVYSMQSILYGFHGTVTTAFDEIAAHLCRVMAAAEALGIRALVLGSPRQRILEPGQSYEQACRTLAMVIEKAVSGVSTPPWLCLEPNAGAYGCQVGTTLGAVAMDVLTHVPPEQAGAGINFDTGNHDMEGGGDLEPAHCARVRHVQVSAPRLAALTTLPAERLEAYAGWVRCVRSVSPGVAVSLEASASINLLASDLFLFIKYFGTK